MWLLLVLFLLIVQGHFSACQEEAERGIYGETLTASCVYSAGLEPYKKWFCRGNDLNSCKMLVETTGSEQLVKKGRVSIQDNHSQQKFTMTLENLQWDDADTYWCAIDQSGTDLGYKFSVIVHPVTTQCHYSPRWETYMKSWCQDAHSTDCTIFVKTTSSEVKKNLLFINQKKRTFSVLVWGK
ncbi:CMRF35-like molecule 4 [Suricata suricatta]|uniref:Ig-like domain-containing protein n=1 Tax=Suricata suricatta TaxID=37032 RepID=A0A673VGR4_SURSU|nr:CMRF35-like molecule 4 [Suricata suricatta]